jgi:hypothetical protein
MHRSPAASTSWASERGFSGIDSASFFSFRFSSSNRQPLVPRTRPCRLEKAKTEKEAHGEFESEHPGYCGAQDTFYVGNFAAISG